MTDLSAHARLQAKARAKFGICQSSVKDQWVRVGWGACQCHCFTVQLINMQFKKKSAAIPENFQTPPLGIPTLFAAVGANVLTHPRQLAAPSESTSGPHHCQSMPWPLCWELMLQTLYSVARASGREISVQCQPAGTGLPNLWDDSLMFVTETVEMFASEEMIS